MNDRIKKLSSWSMPIVIIAGILYLTISLINGKEIFTTSFINSGEMHFKQTKHYIASIFTDFYVFIMKSTIQENKTSSLETAVSTSTPTSTSQESRTSENRTLSPGTAVSTSTPISTSTLTSTSPLFTGKNQIKIYPSGGSVSSANFPDLSLQIIDTGILNGDVFTHATSIQSGQKAAVVFDVRNIGGSVSPEWNFSAEMPILNANFISETQSALAPGEGIRFTIAFNDLKNNATNTISFVVDPGKIVSNDPDRKNNTASTTLFRNY